MDDNEVVNLIQQWMEFMKSLMVRQKRLFVLIVVQLVLAIVNAVLACYNAHTLHVIRMALTCRQ